MATLANEPRLRKIVNALKVIALDPKIREFLEANDPKALEQVEAAINSAASL